MKYEGLAAVAAPPETRLDTKLQQAMLVLLAVFLLTLPLVEAPKNIVAGLYLVLWTWRGRITGDFGGRWSRFDTAFALMIGSAVLSGLAAYAGDVTGVLRVVVLGWLVSRSRLSMRHVRLLPTVACLGLLAAIALASVPFLKGSKSFLELHSVGHANQSALYIAIMTAIAFGWWLQGVQVGQTWHRRAALGMCAAVFCAALLAGGSRAAMVATAGAVTVILAVVLTCGGESRRRILARFGLSLVAIALLIAALGTWAPHLSDRKLTVKGLVTTASTETRVRHWRVGFEAWRQRPLLGWGPDSFQRLKIDDVCAWRQQRGEGCDRDQYLQQTHAHSLYVGTLAERGLLGVFALAFLAGVWAWTLVRSAASAARSRLWVASAASLLIVLIGGAFNTTLRVEHGSLALLWFGLWVAALRQWPAGVPAGTLNPR